jgi:lysophospholipase L1-like esterase
VAILAARRPADEITVVLSAVSGDATTHGLVRFGEVVAANPDWILFFIGVNDARTQGPKPTKTLVDHRETARNLVELRNRASQETKARRLWITPPAVIEESGRTRCRGRTAFIHPTLASAMSASKRPSPGRPLPFVRRALGISGLLGCAA